MRLVTFVSAAGAREIGALRDDGTTIIRLQAGAAAMAGTDDPAFASMLSFVHGGPAARERAQAVMAFVATQEPPETTVPRNAVRLLAPLPRPESIRDCLSFEQHVINITRVAGLKRLTPLDEWVEKRFGRRASLAARVNKEWYRRPIYYKSNPFSVVGPDAEVRIPPYTKMFDFELEFAIIIGRRGTDLTARQARDYIGGYMVYDDFSARDIQFAEMRGRMGPTKGKDFDTSNAFGPYLVTPDEIPNPYALRMTARVNGEEWSRGSSAEMHWSFEEIIAYITRAETLHPGEVIGSGACSGAEGSGCGWELGKFLTPGDVVELEVEGLGVLRNPIVGPGSDVVAREESGSTRPTYTLRSLRAGGRVQAAGDNERSDAGGAWYPPDAVVVTGASTGIGRACALRLDALGFRVFATVLTEAEGAALEREASERLTWLVMDITDPTAIAATVAAVTEAVGDAGLTALVNNAGIAVSGPIEHLPIEVLRKQFEVNVIGHVAVTQAFLPLIRQGEGRLVNIGSVSGASVLPFGGSYAATKHAMRAINAALRMELRPWGIPVSIVDPSSIATPLWNLSVAAGERHAATAGPRQQEQYGRALAAANRQALQLSSEGSPVSVVADAVEHAVTAPKPKARYVVGKNARTRLLVENLPVPLRDRVILRRVLGRDVTATPDDQEPS